MRERWKEEIGLPPPPWPPTTTHCHCHHHPLSHHHFTTTIPLNHPLPPLPPPYHPLHPTTLNPPHSPAQCTQRRPPGPTLTRLRKAPIPIVAHFTNTKNILILDCPLLTPIPHPLYPTLSLSQPPSSTLHLHIFTKLFLSHTANSCYCLQPSIPLLSTLSRDIIETTPICQGLGFLHSTGSATNRSSSGIQNRRITLCSTAFCAYDQRIFGISQEIHSYLRPFRTQNNPLDQ